MKAIIVYFLCMTGIVMASEISEQTVNETIDALTRAYPEEADRIETGVNQVAERWWEEDGSAPDFKSFCMKHFITDRDTLTQTFQRFERNLEILYGHNHEINRDLSMPVELEMDYLLPVDYLFSEYDPFAHIQSDMFVTKIAFIALLNFPMYTLKQKLSLGDDWTREQWAKARLAEEFASRVPSEIVQNLSRAYVQVDDYIANYNIYMHQLVNDKGEQLFPKGLKLITHWGLRDELKAQYANPDGFERQQIIQEVMQDIITQNIPKKMIDNRQYKWNPLADKLYHNNESIAYQPEPNTRYKKFLSIFQAEQKTDPYYPDFPTKIKRRFNKNREILEEQFVDLVTSVLTDPVAPKVAQLISNRLGRDLEPFDIWYNGFKPQSEINEAKLDSIVGERYPTVRAFQNDIAVILQRLGFDDRTSRFLARKINVDPSRGAGHATGAMRSEDNAHLRTRIPKDGMTYKGFNIAIHELGHNVEQVFSLNRVDHYMLNGVPNTAFTEAFAFVFQSRDRLVLGQEFTDPSAGHLKALDTFWSTCEIAAVGLVDVRVWHWLYDHPNASPEELKTAVIDIAKDVWNEYYAPLIGKQDSILLAIYSHMIAFGLYLPDYSIGHIIMYQIEEFLKNRNLGDEMERMCRIGRLTPNAWMREAVGEPISAEPLLQATRKAVEKVE